MPEPARSSGPDMSRVSAGGTKVLAMTCPDCKQQVWLTRTGKISHHSRTSTAGLSLNSCARCCAGAGKVAP